MTGKPFRDDSAPIFKFIGAAKHEPSTIPSSNGRATTCIPTRWKASFSIFKRGIIGVYQHVDGKHFERYLAEFDFRQNTRAKLGINDVQREAIAVKGAKGKRLTYQTTHSEA